MATTSQGFPNVSIPFVDINTGVLKQPWMQLLISLYTRTGGGSGGSTNSGESVQIQEAMGEEDDYRGKDDNPWGGLWGAALISSISSGNENPSLANIANNTFLANIAGMVAPPLATTLTAFLDSAMGNARGDIIYRGASNWAALTLGSNGQVLQSNGTDILWGPVTLAAVSDATILSNVSGGSASPSANTLTQVVDHDTGGAARGALFVRGAASWGNLPLGTSNFVLTSNGTDVVWSAISLASLGNIADATILSNITGGSAPPSANSFTNILDHDMGSSRGDIIYRGAANWAALLLGSTGQMLRSNGTDITWASVIGYAGDQSYQTSNWAPGTNFSTNLSFYTSATTQFSNQREFLAGVNFISNQGSGAGSPQRDKVALAGMIEGRAGSGDTWALYGVNVIDNGAMGTGFSAIGVEIDLNNNSGVNLSSPTTIGGHTAQAFGVAVTGSSSNSSTAALWITGNGAGGGPGAAQWDKGIWFTGNTAIGTACIKDDSQNQFYCLDVSTAVYQKGPINWNTGATSPTATAGAATLPAAPAGFLLFYNGGTPIKVPYYAN